MERIKENITKLCVWDFDGSLVDTPLPDTGRAHYEKVTGKPWPHVGWWSKPESLDTTIFEIPTIASVIESYKEERVDSNTLMVMLTGRIPRLSKLVEAILAGHGLTFDHHIYNMGGATVDSKIKSLNDLLVKYPFVVDVLLTDDRLEHIPQFEEWGKAQLDCGRLTAFKINLVPAERH